MSRLDQKEFQALFAQEAEVRLGSLAQLMLQLEQDGSDEALIGSIFREVHTLKGSAAVVGFERVSRVAHLLEERLEDLRSGRGSETPDLVDALLVAVDSLTVLTALAVAGDDDGADAMSAEAALGAALERFATTLEVAGADPVSTDRLVALTTPPPLAPGPAPPVPKPRTQAQPHDGGVSSWSHSNGSTSWSGWSASRPRLTSWSAA